MVLSYFSQVVARLFKEDEPLCREDAIRQIDMDREVSDKVKRFWHQLQFDDVVKTKEGELRFDSERMYSDA